MINIDVIITSYGIISYQPIVYYMMHEIIVEYNFLYNMILNYVYRACTKWASDLTGMVGPCFAP